MNSTETTFTFANNQYESFTQICAEIREKIDVLDDHNFEDFEQDMYNLSIVFYHLLNLDLLVAFVQFRPSIFCFRIEDKMYYTKE